MWNRFKASNIYLREELQCHQAKEHWHQACLACLYSISVTFIFIFTFIFIQLLVWIQPFFCEDELYQVLLILDNSYHPSFSLYHRSRFDSSCLHSVGKRQDSSVMNLRATMFIACFVSNPTRWADNWDMTISVVYTYYVRSSFRGTHAGTCSNNHSPCPSNVLHFHRDHLHTHLYLHKITRYKHLLSFFKLSFIGVLKFSRLYQQDVNASEISKDV